MSDAVIENAIKNAAFSAEVEGYTIGEQEKEWCRQLLKSEITMQEYIALVKREAGVSI